MSVYIIAEAGVNHNGSLRIAKQMVDAAKQAGCDCIKFQTFNTDKIVTRQAQKAEYQIENTHDSSSQYEMLKKLELSYQDFKILKDYCEEQKIDFLSTPFDEEAVELLEQLGVSQYKISSGEITNKPLIQCIAKNNKRVLMSTGMSDLKEVSEAISWIHQMGNKDIVLFHCTSNYPAPFSEVNMNSMLTLKNEFALPVGYSDHTEGNEISYMAVALGAVMIEKHFTLDRNMDGPDHKASLEPHELKQLCEGIRNIEKAFGDGVKAPAESEIGTLKAARKSLVFADDFMAGHLINRQDIVCKRPGTGIAPKYVECFLGKRIIRDCKKDELVSYEDIGEE